MIARIIMSLLAVATTPASPAPTPSPTPSVESSAIATLPKDFDPCGGPLELLNKIGSSSSCVFVRGEAALSAQYETANIPANSSINFMNEGSGSLSLSAATHAFGYPATVIYIGVLPRAQITITPPSFVQVNSSLAARVTGSSLFAAGATDMSFEYKQLVYVDVKNLAMMTVDLSYEAPTGSPAFRVPGPSYGITPIFDQPLPRNFGLTIVMPIKNSTVVSAEGTHRGWSIAPQASTYWESPGGTLLSLLVQHSFNPNVTPIEFSFDQLFGRHFDVSISEGGLRYSVSNTNAFRGFASASTTVHITTFSVGVNFLFGRSDLPGSL